MTDLDLCMDGDAKDKFPKGNDLAAHHVDDTKGVNLDL